MTTSLLFAQRPIPAAAGIGLRAPHVAQVLEERPTVPWFEVHSENYFAEGGAAHAALARIRADYPLSLHGVGLSLGSADKLDLAHLARLKQLVERYQPALVSDHICWGAIGDVHLNDLLPLPCTREALELRKLAAEVARIEAESEKFKAEARKITRERAYCLVTGISAIAVAIGALAQAFR